MFVPVRAYCVTVTNRRTPREPQHTTGQMEDDLAPPRPKRKPSGNSAEALRALLERHGLHELLAEVDRHRGLTLFGACCEAGLRKRPEPTGNGSQNAAKTRAFYFNKAIMAGERTNGAAKVRAHLVGDADQHHRGAPIDLAAALAEAEEMRAHPVARIQRQARRHDPLPDLGAAFGSSDLRSDLAAERELTLSAENNRLLTIIEQLEDRLHHQPFAHPAIGCTSCSSSCAPAAVRELLDVALAARRGETGLDGSSIPKACCKRQLVQYPDVRALLA